jgi:hypothetical protein
MKKSENLKKATHDRALVIVAENSSFELLKYYSDLKKEFDIVVVSPVVEKHLQNLFKNIIFFEDKSFLISDENIKNTHRPNWYYQQFLKYSIVLKLNYKLTHIIDGDSYLNKNFFFKKCFYYTNYNINDNYNLFLADLSLNLKNNKNFIVNHMLFEKIILKKMLISFGFTSYDFVEKLSKMLKNGDKWFSEYQTYASYALSFNKYEVVKTKVFRRFDLLNKPDIYMALSKYSLVSLEKNHKSDLLSRLRANVYYLLKLNLG